MFGMQPVLFRTWPPLILFTRLSEIQQAMNPFIEAALEEARIGQAEGGIPIGSVIVHQGRIIGRGHNRRVQRGSAILHAEMDALENAGRQPASVYREAVLYTTLSPCAMCSGAILLYGIPKVVIGENQTFTGEETCCDRAGCRWRSCRRLPVSN
jgi:cytosine deaminase